MTLKAVLSIGPATCDLFGLEKLYSLQVKKKKKKTRRCGTAHCVQENISGQLLQCNGVEYNAASKGRGEGKSHKRPAVKTHCESQVITPQLVILSIK